MDWQLIIVYIIIAYAVVITFVRMFRFFEKPAQHCSGCTQAAKGCSLEQLKQEIRAKAK